MLVIFMIIQDNPTVPMSLQVSTIHFQKYVFINFNLVSSLFLNGHPHQNLYVHILGGLHLNLTIILYKKSTS